MTGRGLRSGIFEGKVFHRRLRPTEHAFRYRVFSMMLDLDELPHVGRSMRFFSHNRWNLYSFLDRDHGDRDGAPLKEWVLRRLKELDLDLRGGHIEILCYPRIFGYVFNPLSVYFCRDESGTLRALLYEVSNTFGENHTYVVPAGDVSPSIANGRSRKVFYVSPFNDVSGEYAFAARTGADEVSIQIDQHDAAGRFFLAGFSGRRSELSDARLLRLLIRYPLMTLKVIVAIHWEALRLLRKGTPLHPRPRAIAVQSFKKAGGNGSVV